MLATSTPGAFENQRYVYNGNSFNKGLVETSFCSFTYLVPVLLLSPEAALIFLSDPAFFLPPSANSFFHWPTGGGSDLVLCRGTFAARSRDSFRFVG